MTKFTKERETRFGPVSSSPTLDPLQSQRLVDTGFFKSPAHECLEFAAESFHPRKRTDVDNSNS